MHSLTGRNLKNPQLETLRKHVTPLRNATANMCFRQTSPNESKYQNGRKNSNCQTGPNETK